MKLDINPMEDTMRLTASLLFLALLVASTASALPAFNGTYEDRGSFQTIRLNNGEMLDVTNRVQLPTDRAYGTVVIDGVFYTIYDRGPAIGPVYAVPGDAS